MEKLQEIDCDVLLECAGLAALWPPLASFYRRVVRNFVVQRVRLDSGQSGAGPGSALATSRIILPPRREELVGNAYDLTQAKRRRAGPGVLATSRITLPPRRGELRWQRVGR